MSLVLVITNAGRQALINNAANGTNSVTITQIGVSTVGTTPLATLTALPSELKRLSTISGEAVAAGIIHLGLVDGSADVYALKSFGLYTSGGVLFAVYGQATPIVDKASASSILLSVDIALSDLSSAQILFGDTTYNIPPASEIKMGVVELATDAETIAGTDAVRAVTPKSLLAKLTSWLASAFADVWRASNDGSGSGLDADFLDGQQGSWYADILARLGYTPLNAASYTPADVLGKINTVDGAGSGLDADFLDGQQGSWYADILARLGYTPLNAANYTPADVLGKINTVDGSGSGLDADFLDGQHASAFVTSAGLSAAVASLFSGSLAANGYVTLPNGLIIQWGVVALTNFNGGANAISWPINFPSGCLWSGVSPAYNTAVSLERSTISIYNNTAYGATISNNANQPATASFLAIGT